MPVTARLHAAAPTHAQRSGGVEPPNAGRSTSIECRTIRHTHQPGLTGSRAYAIIYIDFDFKNNSFFI
jgi:hypothetical protein